MLEVLVKLADSCAAAPDTRSVYTPPEAAKTTVSEKSLVDGWSPPLIEMNPRPPPLPRAISPSILAAPGAAHEEQPDLPIA